MKKKIIFAIFSLLLATITSCSDNENLTDLQKIFLQLKNNNFTMEYTDSYANFDNVERHQNFRYTSYSIQQTGDLGFSGIAQSDDAVFRYSIENGEIVSGVPVYDYSVGLRYDNLYSYTYGFQDFNVKDLSLEKNEDGWYTYKFGINKTNDDSLMAILLRYNPLSSRLPDNVKLKAIQSGDGNYALQIDALFMTYEWSDTLHDSCYAYVYDIGSTENYEIKEYLDTGKTSKKPLDFRFFKLINPYLSSYNFTVDMDATGMYGQTFKMTTKFTENAVQNIQGDSTNGNIYSNGYVSNFRTKNGKIEIYDTPLLNESSYYTSLYGDMISYTLADITYANLIGYIDEEHENSYYLTDSELIYILSYICYVELDDTITTNKVRIEIINDDTHEFNAYFDLRNSVTSTNLGTYVAKFRDLNNTIIPEADRYLAKGKNPSTQSKEEFISVMEKFKVGNYSMDVGIAKYYFTEDYLYVEPYSVEFSNFGYIKQGEHIYEFKLTGNNLDVVTIDTRTDYAQLGLPSVGTYLFSSDDFGYISEFMPEQLYNYDAYEVSSSCGVEYWKNTSNGFSTHLYNYLLSYPSEAALLPMGSGFIVQDGEDPYDTRVTAITTFISADGLNYGYYEVTYYDIGATSHPVLEQYLNK